VLPLGGSSVLPLAMYGFVLGVVTVWNASRVPELGEPMFQGRLQSITTMVLGLGLGLGALWGGPALDVFGTRGLLGGALALGVVSLAAILAAGRRAAITGTALASPRDS
jgi:predicted MFS family arabinose efflux permease